jgi:hypothetical protein
VKTAVSGVEINNPCPEWTHNPTKEEVMLQSQEMDWKQDETYLATQRKLSDLSARAKEVEQLTARLTQQVAELERQVIESRASFLAGEVVDSDASSLDKAVSRKRQELHNLEGESAVTTLAISKLQTALQQAETAAKIRIAEALLPVQREAVCNLHELLRRCKEANEEVRRLHFIVSKQNLIPALAGNPIQKLLMKNVALNYISEAAVKDWEEVASPILQGKTDIEQ